MCLSPSHMYAMLKKIHHASSLETLKEIQDLQNSMM